MTYKHQVNALVTQRINSRTLVSRKFLQRVNISCLGDGFLLETRVPASYLELEKVVLAKAKSLRQSHNYPVLDAKQFK